MNNYSVRYRQGLNSVIDVEIKPHEKVGILGRTGAGKSFVTPSLFRIIEAAEGEIDVDGINLAEIRLHDLNSSLMIIMQTQCCYPELPRFNLHLFDHYSDEDNRKALEQVNLKDFATAHPEKLDYVISEGGDNIRSDNCDTMVMNCNGNIDLALEMLKQHHSVEIGITDPII